MIDEVQARTVAAAAEAVVKQIDPRIQRMELAILGDDSIGHSGLVQRVRALEVIDQGIETRRAEGERRLNERVTKVERKLDRFLWVSAGIGLGSGGAGAWLTSLLT